MAFGYTVIIIVIVWVIFLILFMFAIPRIRMNLRAKQLLDQIPIHETKELYISFDSAFYPGKRAVMDAKIAEMAKEGWIYLKSKEANPLKTIKSWGGGLNMYFIRKLSDDTSKINISN